MSRALYLSLRLFTTLNAWLIARLTPTGWVLLASAGAAGAAGIDTHQTLTYQAFTLLASLLAIAWGASLLFRARVQIERDLPRYLTAGETAVYRVRIRNLGAKPLAGLTLLEKFAEFRPAYRDWRAAHEPGEARRNWVDRRLGYFRWRWLIERRLPHWTDPRPVEALAGGAGTVAALEIRPRRRGRIQFAGMTVGRTDPLGLVRGLLRVDLPAQLIVLPRRYALPALSLPGRRMFQQGGIARAASSGDSEEFLALREYRPGDPFRKIHWKSYARTALPVVREYQDEFLQRHALVLDTTSPRGEDAAFEETVAIAASFVHTVDTQDCLLDLLFLAGEEGKVTTLTAGQGQVRVEHLLEVLAAVTPSTSGDFEALARTLLVSVARLSSVIMVLSEWDAARRRLAESLISGGCILRAILVTEAAAAPTEQPYWLTVVHPGSVQQGLARLQ